jgi:hypothetical protein
MSKTKALTGVLVFLVLLLIKTFEGMWSKDGS